MDNYACPCSHRQLNGQSLYLYQPASALLTFVFDEYLILCMRQWYCIKRNMYSIARALFIFLVVSSAIWKLYIVYNKKSVAFNVYLNNALTYTIIKYYMDTFGKLFSKWKILDLKSSKINYYFWYITLF